MIEVQQDPFKPGRRLGHYEVLKQIGVGGMGEVYLALDKILDRQVALKILNEKYSGEEASLYRFIREAKAASALNHPNILVIHEVGECDGIKYLVSEFIEGRTLREELAGRELALSDVLDISIQVASALVVAHKANIVHRDIKPENIMIRPDGYVKILDFGLAKLVQNETRSALGLEEPTMRQNETSKGMIVGTVSYMSPEQAKGEKVDERTDIFSLGALLYELVTGRAPFDGASLSDTFANLINTEPQPISRFRRDVPDQLLRLISKMLRKNRDERYQTMRDVHNDLKELKADVLTEIRSQRLMPSAGEHATAIFAAPESVEVPSGATGHPGSGKNKRQWGIGAALLAGLIGLVSVVLVGGMFLSKTWQGSGTPQPTPSGGIQDARSKAYDLYIRGKVKAGMENREETDAAIKLLEEAVQLDPGLVGAHAQLARAYNTRAFKFFSSAAEQKSFQENAEVEVQKALELNPELAEAHFARGLILWNKTKGFPHELAIQSYKRSLELDPKQDETHHQLSVVYAHIGLLDEAQESLKKTLELNPNNTMARFRVGNYLVWQGKPKEALAVLKNIPDDVSPLLVDRIKAEVLIRIGELEGAQAIVDGYLESHPNDEGGSFTSVKALLLAKAGKREEAENAILRATDIGKSFGHFHHTEYNIASAYAAMKETDLALRWLRAAADHGFPCYSCLKVDPNLENLRSDNRFAQLTITLQQEWERLGTVGSQ